jgi:succinyl-CoA synthetase alpha subunit
MARIGLGQSTVVGIGADPIVFTNLAEILRLFEKDPQTEQVLIVGEVGGRQEEKAAEYIDRWMTKPVIAYIAGLNTPEGKKMGHAGAIMQGDGRGTVQSKVEILQEVGVKVAKYPADVVEYIQQHTNHKPA